MLIGVVLAYIAFVTPITITAIIASTTNQAIFGLVSKELIILQGVGLTFEQMNHSSNFIIYVLFSTQFRRRFLDMIPCRMKCGCCRDASSQSNKTTNLKRRRVGTEIYSTSFQER